MVRSKDDLKKAISIAFEHSDTIIIEDFIEGREFRCSVIEKCVDGEIEVGSSLKRLHWLLSDC